MSYSIIASPRLAMPPESSNSWVSFGDVIDFPKQCPRVINSRLISTKLSSDRSRKVSNEENQKGIAFGVPEISVRIMNVLIDSVKDLTQRFRA